MFETTNASILGGSELPAAFPAVPAGRIPLYDVDEFGPIAGAALDGAALGGGRPLAIEQPWRFGDQGFASLHYLPP